ncbi:MAG: Glucosamine-6-phosphate deaminase 1 [Syntrophomonadaceae bacterium]|nr:Glucosamine-6-phosphate deaminase 1 [Bacillota bacterium]
MDEYLDIDPKHPASFRLFLKRYFLDNLVPQAKKFYPVPGESDGDPLATKSCQAYEALLRNNPIDLCVMGLGENGHIAFNDPPYADFNDRVWVKVVKLDEISRRQQVGEGHFPNLNAVPTDAVTVTIPALLAARKVLVIVPEARKSRAVERSLCGPITPDCPGSILRTIPHAHLFLDNDSAALAFPDIKA